MKRLATGLGMAMASGGLLFGEVVSLKDGEDAAWRREVLPLPHELSLKQVQRLKPGDVTIKGRSGASGLEQISVSNVIQLFKENTGVMPEGAGFEILIGLMDDQGKLAGIEVPQAARLKEVPNRDQAYVIQPVGEKQLVVAAVADRGLYYGTRTLAQWLGLHLTNDVAEIPMASVVDWPDLEERGFWHMPLSMIPWLASMKMNRFYLVDNFSVDKTGIRLSSEDDMNRKPTSEWAPPFEKARRYAAEVVRGPGHLDYWERTKAGYRKAYPELLGKGEAAKCPNGGFETRDQRCPCASNPELVRLLAMSMTQLAAQKASEVMVWMSEAALHCECEKCMKEGQFRAEARSALEAWKEAKKSYPDLKLSVFFGLGGWWPPDRQRYPDQEIKDVVASLPPDVTMRPSMGCDGPDGRLLADFAARGKRIARMNVVALSSSFMSDDVRQRMEQIVSDKYIGAWQFTPGLGWGPGVTDDSYKQQYNYRASALAEYSWNSKGRSAKEFAEAWAVRQGYKEPAKFVAWIDAMNMPQAARVGSCWPASGVSWFYSLPKMTAERKWDFDKFNRPVRAERGIKHTPEEIEAGIGQSEQALALAEELGGRDLILQSRLMLTYCRLEQAGYLFISKLQGTGPEGEAREKATGESFAQLKEALSKYVQARIDVAVRFMAEGAANQARKQGCAELEAELDKVKAELAKTR